MVESKGFRGFVDAISQKRYELPSRRTLRAYVISMAKQAREATKAKIAAHLADPEAILTLTFDAWTDEYVTQQTSHTCLCLAISSHPCDVAFHVAAPSAVICVSMPTSPTTTWRGSWSTWQCATSLVVTQRRTQPNSSAASLASTTSPWTDAPMPAPTMRQRWSAA